ncbi:Sel1 repeat family protein [Babesia bovis T2Bo]|uniref:Uncharacterized protein n=1 Tax=Babesia bovis TaxID=5865 RepID=A7AP66_BABBO|nr:Sel1 repeat family protein [Babesia bovis T2Bo]EDO08350.1 Sel1 repeat family protein [Babesia bovis T2Bo]|eukprot:XP_001611918.1 hypothetical protein [Babesia bovis T2Bo]
MRLFRAVFAALVFTTVSIRSDFLQKVECKQWEPAAERVRKLNDAMAIRYGTSPSEDNPKGAMKLFQELAEGPRDSITVQCWYELGKIHLFGVDSYYFWRQRDVAKAKELFLKATEYDHGPSMFYASFIYTIEGEGPLTPDPQKAGNLLRRAASVGYVPAILALGYRKLFGIGCSRDVRASIALYKKAYRMNRIQSDNLSYMVPTEDMIISPKSIQSFSLAQSQHSHTDSAQRKESLKYWESKAGGGDGLAMYEMAKLMEEDPGAEEAVANLYKNASNKGVVAATRDIGLCYLNGIGVRQNAEKAVDHLKLAAKQGDNEAAKFLGYIYYRGVPNPQEGKPIARDEKLAIKYFSQAARHEVPEAMYFMGEIFARRAKSLTGDKSPKLMLRALAMYSAAADYGLTHALLREADLLESGIGVKPNLTRAALNYKSLAESSFAIVTLRDSFHSYLQKDYLSSFLHNTIAAFVGIQAGQFNVGQLYLLGRGLRQIQNASRIAKTALVQCLKQGSVQSLRLLGRIAEQDGQHQVALDLYSKGFKGGDMDCLYPLVAIFSADGDTRHKAVALLEHKQYRNARSPEGNNSGLLSTWDNVSLWVRIKTLKARLAIDRYTKRDKDSL